MIPAGDYRDNRERVLFVRYVRVFMLFYFTSLTLLFFQ